MSLIAALVVLAPPVKAAGPTYVSGTISSSTTWSLANSPYVITGNTIVAAGTTLTIEPGVVVRFQVPSTTSKYSLSVRGTIVAEGLPGQNIVFTSDRDADHGGSGGAAPGDWGAIALTTVSGQTPPSATSTFSRVVVRYGGQGSACDPYAQLEIRDTRRVRVTTSTFEHAHRASIRISSTSAISTLAADRVQILNSRISGGQCGISSQHGNFIARYNSISTSSRSISLLGDIPAAVIEWNSLASEARLWDSIGTSVIRYNDLLAGVDFDPGGNLPFVDLRYNWWGHVPMEPPFCETASTPADPPYNTELDKSCPTTYARVTEYDTTVLPALESSVFASYLGRSPFTARQRLGGMNPAARSNACAESTGYPVDCESGNFWHTFDLLHVPGRGPDLSLSMTYNALAAAENGALGYGWTHSYLSRLVVSGSSATVAQENGAEVPFTLTGSTWSAPSHFDATLMQVGSEWQFERLGRERFTFDSSGRLVEVRDLTDPVSYATTLDYSTPNTIVVESASGRSLTMTVSGGRITSVSDSASPPRTVSFTYDAVGDLVSYTDVTGGTWAFEYAASSHLLTTMRKPNEAGLPTPPKLVNTYDAQGRVVVQTDWLGRATTFYYDTPTGGALSTTLVTDPAGHSTMKTFSSGVLVSETAGYGTSTESTRLLDYDPVSGGVSTVTHPDGTETHLTYDTDGNTLSVTDPLGRQQSFTYDSFGNVLTATGPNPSTVGPTDVTTSYTYDSGGRLLSVTRPLYTSATAFANQVTTYHRDDSTHPDDVTRITDPEGNTTALIYDATTGDLLSSEDPLGHVTTFDYDDLGRVETIVAPRGNEPGETASEWATTMTYDDAGRPLTTTAHTDAVETATTTRTYDADGNLESVTDPNGHTTTYVYDAADQLVTVVRPDLSEVDTEYWPDGKVKIQRDASNTAVLAYTYDAQGRPATSADATNNVTTFGYDANGRVTSRVHPGGSCSGTPTGCVRYTYDDAGQLLTIDYSDTTPDVTYTYTPAGQRATMVDGTGTTTYTYDSLGRLTSVEDGTGADVTTTYDLRNLPTSTGYPGFGEVTRTFDEAGRMDSLTDWTNQTFTFDYDADGNLTTVDYPTDTVDTYAYDRRGALIGTTVEHDTDTVATFDYERDAHGFVTADDSTVGTTTVGRDYGYTDLDQLGSLDAASYGYDSADNLTTFASGVRQGYNAANQVCWRTLSAAIGTCGTPPIGATTYAYDTRGNRTTITPPTGPATTLAYDQANRLTSYGTAGSYTYNGDGLRATKTVGTTTTNFVWDHTTPIPLLLVEDDVAYIYGPDGRVLEQLSTRPDITLVASGAAGDDGGPLGANSLNIPLTGIQAGDQIIVASIQASTHSAAVTAPAGYESIGTFQAGTPSASAVVFRKTATGTETNATVSYITGLFGKSAVAAVYRGVDQLYPIDAAASATANAQTNITAPAVDTSRPDERVITIAGAVGVTTGGTWTSPSGTTQQVANTSATTAAVLADETQTIPGSTGTRTASFTASSQLVAVLLAAEPAPETIWYHHDQLGSVRVLTDTAGRINGSYTYDPHGTRTVETPANPSVINPLGFGDEYHDAETGLIYLRARYYDPATGQFLSRDAIEAITREPYAYAGNNPINNIDPSGLNWFSDRASDIGGAIAGGVDTAWDNTGGRAVSYVSDHAEGLGQISSFAAVVGYASCPLTAGVGCAVGGVASTAAAGFYTVNAVQTCASSGIITADCGFAALDAGLATAGAFAPNRFALSGRHFAEQTIWRSRALWNIGLGGVFSVFGGTIHSLLGGEDFFGMSRSPC